MTEIKEVKQEEKETKEPVKKATAKKKVETKKAPEPPRFKKEQLLQSNRFTALEKSFLEVLLDDETEYSVEAANGAIQSQYKRKVEK